MHEHTTLNIYSKNFKVKKVKYIKEYMNQQWNYATPKDATPFDVQNRSLYI